MEIVAALAALGIDANTALIVYCVYCIHGIKADQAKIEVRIRHLEQRTVLI